jgi:tetratricopeptide (TPR) repeat protein
MQQSIPAVFSIGRNGRRIAWSMAAAAVIAGLAAAAWRYRGRIKHELKERMRSNASRVAEVEAAYQKRDWARALELSGPLYKALGNDRNVRRLYARAAARMGRDEAAAAVYRELASSAPMLPEDDLLLGLVLERAGEPEAALEAWQTGAIERPDHPELLDCLARLAIRLRKPEQAAEAARALARHAGWEGRGFLLLGDAEDLMEKPAEAAAAIRQGLERDSEASGVPLSLRHYRKLLARSLLELGRPGEALRPLEAIDATSGLPGADPEASWLLSRACLQEGRAAEAARALVLSGTYRSARALAFEPSPYVGAARCAACHPKESRAHERSRHARTFRRGAALLELPIPEQPLADPADARVTHHFSREDGRIHVKTQTSGGAVDLVVEYAFGTPDRCVTMVGRDEQTFRASRLSSYHTATGVRWDHTAGDVPDSNGVGDVRGQPIPIDAGAARCLYCHVTRPGALSDRRSGAGLGPEAADAGIGCERCHGPGANHLAAVASRFADRAIACAHTASPASSVALCADCHVVDPPSEIRNAPDDPRFVRSTGLTLTLSRCYTESDGRLGCLMCHDPHRDDDGTAAFYEGKCLACHSRQPAPVQTIARAGEGPTSGPAPRPAVCRVNAAKGCITCHMPKVAVASLHTSFTDHYIRARAADGTTK